MSITELYDSFSDVEPTAPELPPDQSCSFFEQNASPKGQGLPKFADRPLYNARPPVYRLAAERPEHRAICFLAAQGLSITEIAQKTGWTTVMIGYVIKQEWAKELILEEIHKAGGDAVALTLQAEALPSIQKLIELRDSAESQRETQRKAANDLLDRIYGKAIQPICHSEAKLDELSDEELAAIVAKGKRN